MDAEKARLADGRDVHGWQIHAVVNDARFEEVPRLRGSHDGAVLLAFRRGCAQMRRADYALCTQQRVGREIRDIGRDASVCQRFKQRGFIDQPAARIIQNAHAFFAKRQRPGGRSCRGSYRSSAHAR